MEEISVKKIFKEKNPKLAKLIPGFLYRYLEKIIHQKDLNDSIPVLMVRWGWILFKQQLMNLILKSLSKVKKTSPKKEDTFLLLITRWVDLTGLFLLMWW